MKIGWLRRYPPRPRLSWRHYSYQACYGLSSNSSIAGLVNPYFKRSDSSAEQAEHCRPIVDDGLLLAHVALPSYGCCTLSI